MNERGIREGRDAGPATGRWWLDPALARLAFGNTTRVPGDGATASVSPSDPLLMQRALRHTDSTGPDLDDPAQRDLGDYELLELIGQGGMGLVYRAYQRSLDREVAIKLLSAGTWAPDELVDNLRREARHAARLQHPNIVVVHEAGEHDGLVFYAMQLVRGRSLSQRLATGEVPAHRESAALLRTVAEAVDYAHRLGVLHLDLKPGNIVIDGDGVPLVADFGLARRIEQVIGVENEQVSGTPAYMAPEQARLHGPPLSPATDVWALGAILYELLAGAPPFDGGDAESTLQRLLAFDLHAPSQRAKVPADLEAICLKCLACDPRDRYQGARALADDLGRYLEGRNVSVRHPGALRRVVRWARREPGLAAAGSLAAIALLAGVVATSLQWRRAEANARHAGSALAAQRVLALQHAHALGRDQDALAGLAANLAASEAAGDEAGTARDRRRLGYTFAALPRLVDHFRLPQRLASLALSPDGRFLAIGTLESSEVLLFDTRDGRRLWRASLAGEPAFFGSGNFERAMNRLRFSPDGRYLLVGNWWPTPVVSPSGIDHWRIEVATGAVARPQRVFEHLLDATYSDDGRYALLRRIDTHQVQLWDADGWRPSGAPAPYDPVNPAWLIAPGAAFVATWTDRGVAVLEPHTLARRHDFPGATTAAWTAWSASPDARWLALGNQEGAVVLADPATGAQRRLLPGPAARVHWLQFSADGRWLVAGSEEGSAWLWQRDDDFRHGRRIRVDTPALEAGADPATGLVRIAGPDAVSLWQVSGLAEADRPALRRTPLFRHAQPIARFASDLHAASGLFATASIDGDVRLWRLPATPLRRGGAAPQLAAQLHFDGVHLVAVDGRNATVVRAADNRAAASPFVHPQPVGFAALTADGASLVTSSGRELRVFDWRRGRLRFPPLALPNSPMKLALDPAGRRVYASWTAARRRALTEAVGVFSLADGHPLAPAIETAGGLSTLAPTADGSRLLLATADGFSLRDGASLRPVAGAPVANAQAVAVAGSRVVVATSAPDAIRRYDLATSRWLADEPAVEPPVAVAASRDGASRVALLPGNGLVSLAREGSSRRIIDAPDGSQFVRAAAFSADGMVLAQGLADGVLLLDAASGEWLAPPLRAPIPAPDLVAQLAFSPDGTRLLGRTRFGRWLWWRLDPETREAATVAREVKALAPARGAAHVRGVAAQERHGLRRGDPGPAASALPAFSVDGCLAASPAPVPRSPLAPARLLDLTAFATLDPREHNLAPTTLAVANLCGLPLGVQRMDGVDFDVRVAIRPHRDRNKTVSADAYGIASGIPVPTSVSHVAALELLATSTTFVQDPPPESRPAQLDVVLRYVDGGSARLPVRYGREIMMWTERPPAASRVAWSLVLPRVEAGVAMSPAVHLFRVRVPNPHPRRAVGSLDLEARRVTWNGISVFAITVDPLPATAEVAVHAR